MTVQADQIKKRRGRPTKSDAKEKVTMMMQPALRESLRALAEASALPYQTLAHQILAEEVANKTAYLKAPALHRLAFVAYDLQKLADQAEEEIKSISKEDQAKLSEAFTSLREAAECFREVFVQEDDDD